MKTACFSALCLSIAFALSASSVRGQSPGDELALAGALLVDAGIRSDTVGIQQVRRRLETLLEHEPIRADAHRAAQAHYYLGFASWQLLNNTYRSQEDALQLADEALAHFKKAVALREDFPRAYAMGIMTYWMLFRLAPERAPTLGPEVGQMMQQAQIAGSDDPHLALIDGMNQAFDPNGPARPEGVQRLEEALALFEKQQEDAPTYPAWWPVVAHAWMGQVYLAMAQPDVEKARAAFEQALRLRPDYKRVVSMLLATVLMRPLSSRRLTGMAWQSLATDAEGDTRNAALADGKALLYAYDAKTDSLWFKFELHHLPDPGAFGINLAFDTDRDQETGGAWWGGNTTFSFDRAVTLWVTQAEPGLYRGTVGITDYRSVRLGQFTNLAQNNLAFSIDADAQVIFVGFKRTDLGDVWAMNVLGAVGSNLVWNDDLMDEGYGEIDLAR